MHGFAPIETELLPGFSGTFHHPRCRSRGAGNGGRMPPKVGSFGRGDSRDFGCSQMRTRLGAQSKAFPEKRLHRFQPGLGRLAPFRESEAEGRSRGNERVKEEFLTFEFPSPQPSPRGKGRD
jgi:hypothetical protein